MQIRPWLASLLCALAVACGSDDPAGPVGDHGDFAITVGSGAQPSYSWSTGGAFSVSVVRTSAPGQIVWGIADPLAKSIGSPLTHGAVPGTAVESSAAEKSLTAGVEYRVSVTLPDGRTGWTEFKP